MIVELIQHTPAPEQTVAVAARLCYSACGVQDLKQELTGEAVKELLDKLIKMGHVTPLEHVSFTFGIEGVSRVTTHQLVRHRMASFSQQSQRYVPFEHNAFVMPQSIAEQEPLRKKAQSHMAQALELYAELTAAGVPKEDARYILPEASASKIIATMNARELLHFFSLRCCNRAQWEIRELATEMARQCKAVCPILFSNAGPGCVRGACPEKTFSCGKGEEVREKFRNLA